MLLGFWNDELLKMGAHVSYCMMIEYSILYRSTFKPGLLAWKSSFCWEYEIMRTVFSGQINLDWDCLQANHMSGSFQTDNGICSF
jgi:hypothetical protein